MFELKVKYGVIGGLIADFFLGIYICEITNMDSVWPIFFLLVFIELLGLWIFGTIMAKIEMADRKKHPELYPTPRPDKSILGRKAANGDEKAWKELVDQYKEDIEKYGKWKEDE